MCPQQHEGLPDIIEKRRQFEQKNELEGGELRGIPIRSFTDESHHSRCWQNEMNRQRHQCAQQGARQNVTEIVIACVMRATQEKTMLERKLNAPSLAEYSQMIVEKANRIAA